ncbi:DNA binding protein [Acinetobacter phage vB_AbaP_AS12]|uniref:DNA binding protein n=1 Tax=Acinetobacter phage vB_AbaP_AS12 TaxID=1932885 RepID=A0A218KRD0_9CAUD|nr:DNA binding protein [Acinetobacter phage vB_AbaP_AS12]APW79799.1 DNA binding protein [Acinetobacter phage vB_AbaP_AS12]
MKCKNCVVGQRVQVKHLIGFDKDHFSEGDTGIIMRTDDVGDSELHVYVKFDGSVETCDRFLYPSQLRKVKGDAS